MAGIKEEYFYIKQVHALWDVGAHYWLNRTKYNHVIVSRIGGWKSVQTLIALLSFIKQSDLLLAWVNSKKDSENGSDITLDDLLKINEGIRYAENNSNKDIQKNIDKDTTDEKLDNDKLDAEKNDDPKHKPTKNKTGKNSS